MTPWDLSQPRSVETTESPLPFAGKTLLPLSVTSGSPMVVKKIHQLRYKKMRKRLVKKAATSVEVSNEIMQLRVVRQIAAPLAADANLLAGLLHFL